MRKYPNNFLLIRKFSFSKLYFLYFDVPEHLSIPLFRENGVNYSVQRVWKSDAVVYDVIMVRIRKRDFAKFAVCMEMLKSRVSMYGYSNYEEEVSNMLKML